MLVGGYLLLAWSKIPSTPERKEKAKGVIYGLDGVWRPAGNTGDESVPPKANPTRHAAP